MNARKCLGAVALAGGLSAVALAGPAAAATPPCGTASITQNGGVTTCTYDYTGQAQSFNPPSGLQSVNVDMWGGAGADGGRTEGGAGGLGAKVTGTLPVSSSDPLEVFVGGGASGGTGGWNGGGNGGGASDAGGGGGATDIRDGAFDTWNRLLVAAGGGGGGGDGDSLGASGGPGGAADQNGAAGNDAQIFFTPGDPLTGDQGNAQAGQAGTAGVVRIVDPLVTVGGDGGLPGFGTGDGTPLFDPACGCGNSGEGGDTDAIGDGGNGGFGNGDNNGNSGDGGGGGGGLDGGGGGGGGGYWLLPPSFGAPNGGQFPTFFGGGGGGGGGGLSWAGSTGAITDGVQSPAGANGQVVISYGPVLTLTQNAPSTIDYGKQVQYTLTVGNTGDQTATDTTVTDRLSNAKVDTSTLPSGCSSSGGTVVTCKLGDLDPGVTGQTISFSATPGQASTTRADASVTSDQYTNVSQEPTASVTTAVNVASLRFTNGVSEPNTVNGQPTVGQPLDYAMTVESGPGSGTNTVVTDSFPAGSVTNLGDITNPADGSGTCATFTDATTSTVGVRCTFSALKPNTTETIKFEATPTAATRLTATATATADNTVRTAPAQTVSVNPTAGPELSITNTGSANSVTLGAPVTYTLVTQNTGRQAAAAATVTDTFDPNMFIDTFTSSQGSCTQDGQTVTCDLGRVNPSGRGTITIKAVPLATGTLTTGAGAANDAPHDTGGTATASATVTATPLPGLPAGGAPPQSGPATPVGTQKPQPAGTQAHGGTTTVTGPTTTVPGATTTVTEPTGTPASAVRRIGPTIRIWAIHLAGSKVAWCKTCTYPSTELSYKLSRKTNVRLVLTTKVHGHWKQVAMTTLHGQKGANAFMVGRHWHAHLRPHRTMRVVVHLEQGTTWKIRRTLKLQVH